MYLYFLLKTMIFQCHLSFCWVNFIIRAKYEIPLKVGHGFSGLQDEFYIIYIYV